MPITLEQAQGAKQKILQLAETNPALLDAIAGIGIAFFKDGYGVKVNLSKPIVDESLLPPSMDGVPLRVELIGEIKKLT